MAFEDKTLILYDDSIKIEYHDKAHKYYRLDRLSYDLPVDNKLAWASKKVPVKGVTTMMDNVLEKKGLLTWPMGMALQELFGFYDFTNEEGVHLTGLSKGGGTLLDSEHSLVESGYEHLITAITSASKAWQRKKKTGADIGSLVHEAIEYFVTGRPYTIDLATYQSSQEFTSDAQRDEWLSTAPEEVKMAQIALKSFKAWWKTVKPELVGSEFLVYSKEFDYAGATDALLRINGKLVMADWKTSKASKSREAAAPQGVYYSYFIQLGLYALAWYEMTGEKVDDLLCVSARKDGGFDTILASEVDLTVDEAMEWGKCVVMCHNLAKKVKKALNDNVKEDK